MTNDQADHREAVVPVTNQLLVTSLGQSVIGH
jgi:hypothetical protein